MIIRQKGLNLSKSAINHPKIGYLKIYPYLSGITNLMPP